MAEVKGKFIKMAGSLMLKNEIEKANAYLQQQLGMKHSELEDEGWYDTKIFNEFMRIPAEASHTKEFMYVLVGKRVYPTIKRSVGLPQELKDPLDFLKFEAQGFLMNHRGNDVVPRRFIKAENREVIVEAKAPGYNGRLYEGVFLGILEMCNVRSGRVEVAGSDIFTITW